MAATFTIDQAGLPAGTSDTSRTDGLLTGALVTLTVTSGAADTHKFELLWVPVGDTTAVSSLAPTSATVWTFSPTAGKPGTYRIKYTKNAGMSTEETSIRLLRMRTTTGIIVPSLNEIADPAGTLLNTSVASEDNATDYTSDAALNSLDYSGWFRAMHEWVVMGGSAAQTWEQVLAVGNTATTTPTLGTGTPLDATTELELQARTAVALVTTRGGTANVHNVEIQGRPGDGSAAAGGDAGAQAGAGGVDGDTGSDGGASYVRGGAGGAAGFDSGAGGAVDATAGDGGAVPGATGNGGDGGQATLEAGAGGQAFDGGNGGDVRVIAGAGGVSDGGTGANWGDGGDIIITAGLGANGGDITLTPGASTTGNPGQVIITNSDLVVPSISETYRGCLSMTPPFGVSTSAVVVAYDYTNADLTDTVANNKAAANKSGNPNFDQTAEGGGTFGNAKSSELASWMHEPVGRGTVWELDNDRDRTATADAGLHLTGSLTFEWCGYVPAVTSGNNARLVQVLENTTNYILGELYYNGTAGQVTYRVETSPASYTEVTYGVDTPQDAGIIHLCLTRDSSGNVTLYINGWRYRAKETGGLPTNSGSTAFLWNNCQAVGLEVHNLGCRIFDVELTDEQVRQSYLHTISQLP